MTEWPLYAQIVAGGPIAVVGIWLLLYVAAYILMNAWQRRVD